MSSVLEYQSGKLGNVPTKPKALREIEFLVHVHFLEGVFHKAPRIEPLHAII